MIKSYRDLIVWQKAMRLVEVIYYLTNTFPEKEKFSLTSQLRRAAVSIPANIAEGRGRGTRKDFSKFLRIAFGSKAELERVLEISFRLKYIDRNNCNEALSLTVEVSKMLTKMIRQLTSTS